MPVRFRITLLKRLFSGNTVTQAEVLSCAQFYASSYNICFLERASLTFAKEVLSTCDVCDKNTVLSWFSETNSLEAYLAFLYYFAKDTGCLEKPSDLEYHAWCHQFAKSRRHFDTSLAWTLSRFSIQLICTMSRNKKKKNESIWIFRNADIHMKFNRS